MNVLAHVLAGYRVATRTCHPDWQEAGLTGPHLLSISDCMADLVPVDSTGWDRWFASSQEAEIGREQAGVKRARCSSGRPHCSRSHRGRT